MTKSLGEMALDAVFAYAVWRMLDLLTAVLITIL